MNFETVDNKLIKEADKYIRDHRLLELFEDLATSIAYRQPENLEDFIIERLNIHKDQGLRCGIFTESEVQNIFNLFDLKKEGFIGKDRTIKGKINNINKAIQTMASSNFQYSQIESEDIPERVDSNTFNNLCQKVLGFSKVEL